MKLRSDDKPDCVVIDTNIWRSQWLLRTPIGVSFVYTLGRQQGLIGLPEIVEVELPGQIVEAGLEAAARFRKAANDISTLSDSPIHSTLPDASKLEDIVADRLEELAPILARVPFTLEHAKAALIMVNSKLPPNGEENQQFKDSAIWQAVLTLTANYCVHLVSNDRAFLYKKNEPLKGLAENLVEDCNRLGVNVGIYCDLASCLTAITRDAPLLDHAKLSSLILPTIMPRLQSEARKYKIIVGEVLENDVEIKTFKLLGTPNVAVDYTVTTSQCENDPCFEPDNSNLRAVIHGILISVQVETNNPRPRSKAA